MDDVNLELAFLSKMEVYKDIKCQVGTFLKKRYYKNKFSKANPHKRLTLRSYFRCINIGFPEDYC